MITLSGAAFAAAARKVDTPFEMALDAAVFRGDAVLRLLPGRRLVARGGFGSQDAVLKWFVGAGSRRYLERERRGLETLRDAGIEVPGVLWQGEARAGGHAMVLTLVEGRALTDADLWAVAELCSAFAALHRHGALHADPHLGNFLATPSGAVVCVDGDAVRPPRGRPVTEAASFANLAQLLAQLPPAADATLAEWLDAYRARRGWAATEGVAARLRDALAGARRVRTADYLGKSLRDCTEFAVTRVPGYWSVARRDADGAAMEAFRRDPEGSLRGAALLKDGNSATVYRTSLGEHPVVVKRYNVKSPVHRLRRWFKPRARIAWQNGHRLALLRIPTAPMLALVEERFGPLRGRSWLVMEDRGDAHLGEAVAREGWRDEWLEQVTTLLATLRTLALSHGDMKATNLLIQGGVMHLIDLDAMVEVRAADAPARSARDCERLLANWADRPELAAALRRRLQCAGLLKAVG